MSSVSHLKSDRLSYSSLFLSIYSCNPWCGSGVPTHITHPLYFAFVLAKQCPGGMPWTVDKILTLCNCARNGWLLWTRRSRLFCLIMTTIEFYHFIADCLCNRFANWNLRFVICFVFIAFLNHTLPGLSLHLLLCLSLCSEVYWPSWIYRFEAELWLWKNIFAQVKTSWSMLQSC